MIFFQRKKSYNNWKYILFNHLVSIYPHYSVYFHQKLFFLEISLPLESFFIYLSRFWKYIKGRFFMSNIKKDINNFLFQKSQNIFKLFWNVNDCAMTLLWQKKNVNQNQIIKSLRPHIKFLFTILIIKMGVIFWI